MPMSSPAYLSACTIYRDAAEFLPEWIEVHRQVGFERFFLYDNQSTDEHDRVLAPYVEEGVVTVHEWAMPFLGRNGRVSAMVQAFEHCIEEHRDDSRWIAFIDIDEFMFAPTGSRMSEVMRDYESFPGVAVGRAEFGPSGHETRPPGLVIENYTMRAPIRPDARGLVKSVVNPTRAVRCLGAHHFVYANGLAVDENKRPITEAGGRAPIPTSIERLRINHYWSKSREDMRRKAKQWREAGSRRMSDAVSDRPYSVEDQALAAYGPAVREALAKRGLL
jgi:hypothetical protein